MKRRDFIKRAGFAAIASTVLLAAFHNAKTKIKTLFIKTSGTTVTLPKIGEGPYSITIHCTTDEPVTVIADRSETISFGENLTLEYREGAWKSI